MGETKTTERDGMTNEKVYEKLQCANPAAVAYEAYREHWNATATNNTFMVGWEYVSEHEKKAWWSVVRSLIKSQRLAITPERLLEIRQTAQLFGTSNGWAGTSGKLATMIVELCDYRWRERR